MYGMFCRLYFIIFCIIVILDSESEKLVFVWFELFIISKNESGNFGGVS